MAGRKSPRLLALSSPQEKPGIPCHKNNRRRSWPPRPSHLRVPAGTSPSVSATTPDLIIDITGYVAHGGSHWLESCSAHHHHLLTAQPLTSGHQWAALPDISFVGIVLTMPPIFWPVFKAHRHLQHDLPSLGAAVLQQWAWNLYQVRLHIIVIQHTFGGRLNHFPHLHMMVSAGGLKPALQPAPAGGGRRKFVREKMLRRTGLQNPQKALETRPIRGRVSAPLIPSLLRLRQQGLNQFPVLVRQQLLPCFHDRSSPD